MAVQVFTNAFVSVGGVDLSDHVTSVTIEHSADEVDTTAMSSTGYKSVTGGLKSWSIQLAFQQDYAAASVDATLYPLLGSTAAIVVKPVAAAVSTTNPSFSGTALVTSYSPVSAGVGELATTSITWPGSGAITRAVA